MIKLTLPTASLVRYFMFTLGLALIAAQGNAAKSSKEAIDFSILENKQTYLPYLDADGRIRYLELRNAMEAGQSDIRSGEYLQSRKPSALDPGANIREDQERGKKLVEAGKAKIEAARIEMVALLEAAKLNFEAAQAAAAKLTYTLPTSTWDLAIDSLAQKLLQVSWQKGYEKILFDGIYISTQATAHPADEARNTQLFNRLADLDGVRYTVSMAKELSYDADTGQMSHADASLSSGKQSALILAEILPLNLEAGCALLNLKVMDLNSHEIVFSEMSLIEDIKLTEAESLSVDPFSLSIDSASELVISDPNTILRTLQNLPEPYSFECVVQGPGISLARKEVIKEALVQKTTLDFVADSMLKRLYQHGSSPASEAATADFIIQKDESGAFQLSAMAQNSDRVLNIGPIEFTE